MLGDTDAIATLPVKDLTAASEFYEGKLGLKRVQSEEASVLNYKSGNSMILVYESQYAGTNQGTAATWAVEDVDALVRDLKSKGVTFERYEMPNVKHEGDVHVFGKRRNAWAKDPDGNILSIVNR
jgi:catechol 2,3-dioxygenase-like lactoylglutathione lyase family enzyme